MVVIERGNREYHIFDQTYEALLYATPVGNVHQQHPSVKDLLAAAHLMGCTFKKDGNKTLIH